MTDSEQQQVVTPYSVEGGDEGIDYDKLMNQFGSQPITSELLDRIETLTKQPLHPLLKRGFFFSQRDLGKLLTYYEEGKPFYLYTGRGPSSESMHLGHMISFMFSKYLQDAFNVPLVVQMAEDEKFLWKDLDMDEVYRLTFENAKDIIACGFNLEKTFIFSDLDYMGNLYKTILEIEKHVTLNQVKGVFGLEDKDNVGKFLYPAIQAAPSFYTSFPHVFPMKESRKKNKKEEVMCLIPCGIDQDPYFRVTRDVAPKLGYQKPALIHTRFFPSLTGPQTKMSSSVGMTSIFMTDSAELIREKIEGAFVGVEENGKINLKKDVPFQYLEFFLQDDKQLDLIRDEYTSGKMSPEEVKEILIKRLQEVIGEHQERRNKITDEEVKEFFKIRKINFH